MSCSRALALVLAAAIVAFGAPGTAIPAPTKVSRPAGPVSTGGFVARDPAAGGELRFHNAPFEALSAARLSSRPVLFVLRDIRTGWGDLLREALREPALEDEVRRWELADVDVSLHPRFAQAMGLLELPALRAVGPGGEILASRDGFATADELVPWLTDAYGAYLVARQRSQVLDSREPPGADELPVLIELLGDRDGSARETAAARLESAPALSVPALVRALGGPRLAARIGARDALLRLGAPVSEADPWRPGSLLPALRRLESWAPAETTTAAPREWDQVSRDLDRLDDSDLRAADAALARLERDGPRIQDEVRERLAVAGDGPLRWRLTYLSVRLHLPPGLASRHPEVTDALLSSRRAVRALALEELGKLAPGQLRGLYLELFRDPDPLIRETALRGLLEGTGGRAADELRRFLSDPDANVRVAVLKSLAASATPELVPVLSEYVAAEKDEDLLVHAVRVIRELGSAEALEVLAKLTGSASWRVRTEAAEALGKNWTSFPGGPRALANVMVPLLSDPDSFVQARALQALENLDAPEGVPRMAEIARETPALATAAVKAMAAGPEARRRAAPYLRELSSHDESEIRATVLDVLSGSVSLLAVDELELELDEGESVVSGAAEGEGLPFEIESLYRSVETSERAVVDAEALAGIVEVIYRGFDDTESAVRLAASKASRKLLKQLDPVGSQDWRDREMPSRKEWPADVVEELRRRLVVQARSPDVEERIEAARTLAYLGVSRRAVLVLSSLVASQPGSRKEMVEALSWLPWDERARLFEELDTQGMPTDVQADAIARMAWKGSLEAYSLLLRRLRDQPALVLTASGTLVPALLVCLDGVPASAMTSWTPPPRMSENPFDFLRLPPRVPQVEPGSTATALSLEGDRLLAHPDQHLRAIGFMMRLRDDLDAGVVLAVRILDDPGELDMALRLNALVALRWSGRRELVEKAAVDSLVDHELTLVSMALLTLVSTDHVANALDTPMRLGTGELGAASILADPMELWARQSTPDRADPSPPAPVPLAPSPPSPPFAPSPSRGNGETRWPALPERLKLEHVRPHIDSIWSDDVKAAAAILACRLGDCSRLDVAAEAWRSKRDAAIDRSLTRVIVEEDLQDRVPFLEEIYLWKSETTPYLLDEFSRAIEPMSGEAAEALRERLRRERR